LRLRHGNGAAFSSDCSRPQFHPAQAMTTQDHVTTPGLRTPKAAAIAGIVFAVLQLTAFGLFWSAVPADPLEPGAWLETDIGRVSLALNLMPLAGVAFLWFIGVVRDRIGAREDRFFASVFLGSGLLFLAMMFIAAAITSAIITTYTLMPAELVSSASFSIARSFAYILVSFYAIKMAAVFMIMASTLAIRTRFAPRWLAVMGYGLALSLLIASQWIRWAFAVFPLWVLLVSLYILIDNYSQPERRKM
jgi:MFS family permease